MEPSSVFEDRTNIIEQLQEQIFELIIAIGLGHLSLTPNHMLTKEEGKGRDYLNCGCLLGQSDHRLQSSRIRVG